MESFGLHYARTLKEWRLRFMERWNEIEPMGFDKAFQRKWEYYLAYCEAGFAERHVNVCQLIFGRADETAYQYELASPKFQNQSPATWEPLPVRNTNRDSLAKQYHERHRTCRKWTPPLLAPSFRNSPARWKETVDRGIEDPGGTIRFPGEATFKPHCRGYR